MERSEKQDKSLELIADGDIKVLESVRKSVSYLALAAGAGLGLAGALAYVVYNFNDISGCLFYRGGN